MYGNNIPGLAFGKNIYIINDCESHPVVTINLLSLAAYIEKGG